MGASLMVDIRRDILVHELIIIILTIAHYYLDQHLMLSYSLLSLATGEPSKPV